MAILSLQQIQEVPDLPTEIVPVPEWGGDVVMQGVSVEDGMALLKKMKGPNDEIDPEKALLYAVLYGVKEPQFKEADFEWLKKKSMAALKRISDVFTRISGLTPNALNEARKNSSETGTDGSSLPSPAS